MLFNGAFLYFFLFYLCCVSSSYCEDSSVYKNNDNDVITENVNGVKDDSSIYYKASNVSRSDISDNVVILEGDAEVKTRGYTITGDRIIFNTKNNIFESILFNDGTEITPRRIKITGIDGNIVYCSGLRYNVSTGIGVARDALLFKDDVIVIAKRAKIDYDGTFYLKYVSLTSCKKKDPDWAVILNKAIVFKNNLFFMYDANLMLTGTYFPFLKGLSLAYLVPVEGKSGLKYPSSISFGNNGGLAIKEFGFYIPCGSRRDINFDLSFYIGDGSVSSSLYYRYLIPEKYQGIVLFGLNKISLYRPVYGFAESFLTKWRFLWKHSFLSFYNYEFSSYVDIGGSKSEAVNGDSDNKDNKDLKVSLNFKIKNFLKFLSLNCDVKYEKNEQTKVEEFLFPKITITRNGNSISGRFDISPNIAFILYRSNKKSDFYVKDDHDINFSDDILVSTEIINRASVSKFFKNLSCDTLKNSLKKFSLEGMFEIPLKFNFSVLSIDLEYKARLFFSKYNVEKNVVEFREKPYFIHSVNINSKVDFKLKSRGLKFYEFARGNVFNIKSIFLEGNFSFGLKYNPSITFMQNLFKLEQPYTGGDKKINLFYHTYFGNLDNDESLKFSFKIDNQINGLRLVDGQNTKFRIIAIDITSGYDFLRKICKLDDIKIHLKTSIWNFDISSSCVIFPYQYGKKDSDGRRRKVDKWFFDNPNMSFCKAFKYSVMQFGVDLVFNIKKPSNEDVKDDNLDKLENEENKKDKKNINFYDENDYEKLFIIKNLSVSTKYSFLYKYNPVCDKDEIDHNIDLNLSTKVSRKCSINSHVVYNIKDKYLSKFGLNGDYNLHCWIIKFSVDVSIDKTREVSFSYNVSISPLIEKFSFLSQTRADKMSVV